MKNNTAAAAGGAMPAEGRRSREANPSKMSDQIDIIKALVDAAFMASNELADFHREAMRRLLDETSSKVGEVQKDFTEIYCGGYVDGIRELAREASPAAEGHKVPSLLRIDEALDATRNLIIAASNLAASDEAYPPGLHAVICAAEDKLDDARTALKKSRGIAAAPAADPIFEAIERHKTAWAAYVEATCKLTMPELDAYRETHDDDSGKALEAFLATPPTTLAGLRAALEYVVEVDSGCLPDNGGRIAETLLRSPVFAGMTTEGGDDV